VSPIATNTLVRLAADLAADRTTSLGLVEEALARIADPAGEGKRVFNKVYAETAHAAAEAQDKLRAAGYAASPLDDTPPGTAPVGLMVVDRHGEDRRLLAIGAGIETLLEGAQTHAF
jgi:Asp-tRNA(Asn)/Glu-tRNA(Gln) amidotransferase A subunit family amidase